MKVLPSTELSESLSSFYFWLFKVPLVGFLFFFCAHYHPVLGTRARGWWGALPCSAEVAENVSQMHPLNPLTSSELKKCGKVRWNSKSQSNFFFPADLLVHLIKGSEFPELLRPSGTLLPLRLALWFFVWIKCRSSDDMSSVKRCLSAEWEVLDVSRGNLRLTELWNTLS